jgi:nucleoside-diphosphate-sugar epimerase
VSYNILVTGAGGFIGSHLCEKLLGMGYRVAGVDNFDLFYSRSEKEKNLSISKLHSNFTFHEFDISDSAAYSVLKEDYDAVIHLAAKAGVIPSLSNPSSYIQSNVLATNVLLEWIRQRKISKFIFASSSSVYGNNLKTPFCESNPVDFPISPYAFTKRSCELMNYTYHHLYNIDVINLRFFTVYGERQRPDLAIRKFTKNILEEIPIVIYGDGQTARDYTYCADIINGITLALEYIITKSGTFEIVNLGNNSPIKLGHLIKTICDKLQKDAIIHNDAMRPGDVDITFANIDKAQSLFGYYPSTSIELGIEKFVNWYISNRAGQ